MSKEKIVLMTTLKNARCLLNSVSGEAITVEGMHEIISEIITKLANLERHLEKPYKDK
jgi:uncharacterized membrane protein